MATTTSLVGWIELRHSKRKGMWQARLRWRPDGGRPVTVETFWHEEKAQAGRLAADAQLDFSRRVRTQLLDPRSRASETTLSTFYREQYAPTRLIQLAPNTQRSYAESFRTWIAPYLGGYALGELNRRVGQAWVEWMTAEGAGRAAQEKAMTTVKAVVTHARKRDYVDPNLAHPFELVDVTVSSSRTSRPSPLALSFVQVERIVAAMPTSEDALFTRLIGEIGLRQQEIVPLIWADALDSDGKPRTRLRVERAVSGRGALREVKVPKTDSGHRRPQLFAPVASDVTGLWKERGEPSLSTPIFPASGHRSSDGLFDNKNWARRVFYPALAVAGIERDSEAYGTVTPHRLRAACASALGYAGWPLADVMAQIGHSTNSAKTLLRHYYAALDEAHADLRGVEPEKQIALARRTVRAERKKAASAAKD